MPHDIRTRGPRGRVRRRLILPNALRLKTDLLLPIKVTVIPQ
jgi:hypothetical protein